MSVLSPQEVREMILDKVEKNFLLDGQELSDTQINLAIEMTVADWNSTPPTAAVTPANFPYKHVLVSGVLYRCFMGLSALAARNQFSFSDGGISVPLEERFQLYQALASMYQTDYQSTMTKIKIAINIEEGWGGIGSDYARFPIW